MARKLLAAAALIGAALSASVSQAAEYTVAIVQSMTGPTGFIGTPLREGALYQADRLNKMGFFGPGNTLKVVWGDDAGDRGQAVTLMERYGSDPKVLAVLGPLAGPIAIAGLNAANARQVPAIATTNSVLAPQTGKWAFNLTPPAKVMVPYLANYATDVLKIKSCATIGLHDNEAVLSTEKTFIDLASAKGAKFVTQEAIKNTDTDFSAVATKVASMKDIDCVFISTFAPQAANLVRQLRMAGMPNSVRVLMHSSAASPDLITQGGEAVEGVYLFGFWVPGGSTPEGREFDAAFKAKTGAAPDDWNAMGYTGMYLIANAIKNAGANPSREGVRDALAAMHNVEVIVGDHKFGYDADRIPTMGVQVTQVKGGKFIAAPGS